MTRYIGPKRLLWRTPEHLRERLIEGRTIEPNGCWRWRTLGANGYGYLSVQNKVRLAHRVAYEVFVGPIPDGLELDHLCRNPACLNPDHLEPVTRRVNWERGIKDDPGARQTAKTHCPKGHEYTPENTGVRKKGWRSCKTCRREQQKAYLARKRGTS